MDSTYFPTSLWRAKIREWHLALALCVDDVLVHVLAILDDGNAMHEVVLPIGDILSSNRAIHPGAFESCPCTTSMTQSFVEVSKVGAVMVARLLISFEVLNAVAVWLVVLPSSRVLDEAQAFGALDALFVVWHTVFKALHELREVVISSFILLSSMLSVHGSRNRDVAVLSDLAVEVTNFFDAQSAPRILHGAVNLVVCEQGVHDQNLLAIFGLPVHLALALSLTIIELTLVSAFTTRLIFITFWCIHWCSTVTELPFALKVVQVPQALVLVVAQDFCSSRVEFLCSLSFSAASFPLTLVCEAPGSEHRVRALTVEHALLELPFIDGHLLASPSIFKDLVLCDLADSVVVATDKASLIHAEVCVLGFAIVQVQGLAASHLIECHSKVWKLASSCLNFHNIDFEVLTESGCLLELLSLVAFLEVELFLCYWIRSGVKGIGCSNLVIRRLPIG
mmetsp:Transcript_54358/g.97140  ORF Transcript_54358/g.97140 Transcript_54358/m.97140 type:complete len:451 (-) Transcript_54358:7522-8874(-)